MAQMPSVGQMLKTARRWLRNRDRIYQEKLAREVENYRAVENAHDLPQIFHYWSNKYLVRKYRQFGFSNPKDFYRLYMSQACQEHKRETFLFRQHRFRQLRHGNRNYRGLVGRRNPELCS